MVLSRRTVIGATVLALAAASGATSLAGGHGGGGGGGGGGSPGTKPYIEFKAGGAFTVTEGTANAVIQIERVPKGADSVYFSTNGSPNGAVGNSTDCSNPATDYIIQNNALVTIGSNGIGTALVPICDNSFFENSETVNLLLSQTSGGSPVGGKITGTLTISDNDKAPVLSIDNKSGIEGVTKTFTVTASTADPLLPMSVHWSTGDGTATVADGDYAAQSGDVAIAPGATTATFNVTSIDDTVYEPGPAQYFWVNLSSPVNSSLSPTASSGKFTLTDNDSPPTLSIDDQAANEGSALGFTVTRTGKSDAPVTFDWATADGTATGGAACTGAAGSPNYVTNSALGSSIAPSTNATETFPITITTCDDYTLTGAKTMSVNLSNVAGAVAGDFSGAGTINNTDAPATLTLASHCDPVDCLANSTSYTATVKDAGGNPLQGALVRFEAYHTDGSIWDPNHYAFVQDPFSVFDGAAFDVTGDGLDINSNPATEGAGDATFVLPPTGEVGPDGRNAVLACVVTSVAATPHCGYVTEVSPGIFTVDPVDQTATPLVDWSYTADIGDITFHL